MLGIYQGFCGTRNYKRFRLVASALTYPESTYACKAKSVFFLSPALFFCHALFPLLVQSSVVISLTLYKNALQQRCSCYPAQEQTIWEYRDLWWFSLFLFGSDWDKKSMLIYPRYFFLKERKEDSWTGGVRNWDQYPGLLSNNVSSCISLLVFGILRISSGASRLVRMSGQKL